MPGRDNLYLAADVRELDRIAIEKYGIPGFTLMQRAGKAAFDVLLKEWPATESLLVFCGSGNNGGDGYVIAALAANHGLLATVVTVGKPDKLSGDARLAHELAIAANVTFLKTSDVLETPPAKSSNTVIVDALLGTGLSGCVREHFLSAISWINHSACPVLAVDIPSGLCSDSGKKLGETIVATITVTFIGRKRGQFIEAGPATCGRLVFDNLGVPDAIYAAVEPANP